MTRRVAWITVAVLAVLVLGGTWVLSQFEEVDVPRRDAPAPEARRNPYLAFERFMTRMGRPVIRSGDPGLFDHLPPGGVLILDRNRRAHLTQARVDRLFAWVEGGGYLLVAAEQRGTPDPILDRLGARWVEFKPEPPKQDAAADAPPAPAPAAPKWTPPLARVPGEAQPFSLLPGGLGLKAAGTPAQWTGGEGRFGASVLHYGMGRGNVTVVVNLDRMLSNDAIGTFDHAEFVWALLRHYRPDGPVTLLARLAVPDLFEWLADYAWGAVIAAAALVLLWLWRIVPRFSTPAPEPAPTRRELREHLAAIGRYVWRAGGLGHWLAVGRAAFHAHLSLHHPALAALPLAQRADALAALTHRSRGLVLAALGGPATTPAEFTRAMRTLKNLEHDLRER